MTTATDTVHAALALCGVIDGHNDLPWTSRIERGYTTAGLDAGVPALQTDIPRLRAGGVGGQFWSVFVPVDLLGADAVQATIEQIDFVYRLVAAYPETFALATSAQDVRRARGDGRIASLMGAEGAHSVHDSPAVLRMLARLGVRYLTLTHVTPTEWADAATAPEVHGGLTERGVRYVREMNEIGMLVDLSHVSHAVMRQALDLSSAPVIFSHSSCTRITDHPRNVPDDVLARLSTNGGVQMVSFVPQFLSQDYADWEAAGASGQAPPVTLADAADHVEHAREVAGLDHIGLGGDYDGVPAMPAPLADVSTYPALLSVLAERGWSATELAALTGENILRVLADTDAAFHAPLRAGEFL